MSATSSGALAGGWQTLTLVWARLGLRERRMVALAIAGVVALLVWTVALAPALKTLRSAPAQHETLDTQLQLMRRLSAQAKGMQSRPPIARSEAVRALESSLRQKLGAAAQLNMVGDRVTVVLKGAAPDMLAQWLANARVTARAVATQSRLTRGANGWDGTLVLDLPPSS